MNANEVVIVSAVRTSIGKFKGSFKDIPASKLGSLVLEKVLEKVDVGSEAIDQVIFGQGLQANCGQNPARQASLNAGYGCEIPAITINQVCGSGLRSIAMGYQSIRSGDDKIVVCGGQENMTRAPHCAYLREGLVLGNIAFHDSMMEDGLTDAVHNIKMGVTAENIAERWNISRLDQDEFSLNSHLKAAKAAKEGKFENEIVPVPLDDKGNYLKNDEHIRGNMTKEKMSRLKPCFTQGREKDKRECTVTPGNSCGINDGAAALLLMSLDEALSRSLKPLVKIVSWSQVGVDPLIMGIGPVKAIQKALEKASWNLEDVDLFEINEAFASQSLAVIRDLGVDENKVNVNGGSIALGHPIGASGARIMVTLIHEMKRRNSKRGVAAICVGGGMGVAMCVQNCD